MGNFINEIKQNYSLPNKLKEELTLVLNKRNYLVHRYFKLEIQKFYSELGQKEMLKYFCDFIDQSNKVDKELMTYYAIYTKKLGITDKIINQTLDKMRNEEILREQNYNSSN